MLNNQKEINMSNAYLFRQHTILRAGLEENGTLEIVRKYPSNMSYGNGEPCPDEVIKEIYAVQEGKIVLKEEVRGKHTPARYMPESIDFGDA
jgi:hypothetical protein